MDEAPWHLAIRRYSGTGAPEEIGRRVRENLLPSLQGEAGFRAYFAARLDGGGGVFSVTVFDDRAALEATSERVTAWAASHLQDLLVAPPETTFVEVRLRLAAGPPGGREAYVSIRETVGLGPQAGVLPAAQEMILPVVAAQPGFRRYYAGRDAARPDRAVTVSVFANRDTATAAHERVLATMAQRRDLWPNPARIVMRGEALIAVAA